MQTTVTFRHFKANQPILHEAAMDAVKDFEKFHDDIISTDVVFKNETEKTVEFTVRVQGNTLVVKESSDDFHKSLNEAADKMVRQIKKWKTKRFQNVNPGKFAEE